MSWWVDKHNWHHRHPDPVGTDPDIEIPFLDFTGTQNLTRLGSVRQFLVKHQAILLLPALMNVAIGFQVNSVKVLVRNR
jgi:hypothetical protein